MPRSKVLKVPNTKDYELEEVYRELVIDHSIDSKYVSFFMVKERMRQRFEARRRDDGQEPTT